MKGYLGEFEELVLLTVANLDREAYGAAILQHIAETTGRKLSLGALHSTLARLEEKGFLGSYLGKPTATRGGRRKRHFVLTSEGVAGLNKMKSLRDQLWDGSKINLSV